MKNKVDIWENFGITFNSKSEIKIKDYHFIDLYGSILDRHPNQNTNSIIYDDLTDTSKIFPIYRISKYIKLSDESKDLLTEIFRIIF